MKRRSFTKIPCYKPNTVFETNGEAYIVSDGETMCIHLESNDEEYRTVIDISDILTTLSELV